ncbi:hypothetical protein MMC16_004015 [Acarospora aff. strigata]|nr:hypothetical protein [Acarospora aff. strigata]
MQSRWFDFGGDTLIRADQYIRLTSDRPSQEGWLFSKLPLTATNWEIEFEFKIHGQGSLHGDGFALWLTKQRATPGPVFGHTVNFEGLGIFFDTYKNNRPGVVFPYVMAMLGDGKTAYDQANDGKSNELAGCSARGIRGASQPTKARLTYFQDTSLKLELKYKSEDEWTLCFQLGAVAIPSVAYLGFSAETGELSDNHDIIRIDTQNLYSSTQYQEGSKKPAPPPTKQGAKDYHPNTNREQHRGSWTWFLLKIVLFGVVCVGAYVGWTMYRSSRSSSRF